MTTPTDLQLQLVLAKMLPEVIINKGTKEYPLIVWNHLDDDGDNPWLHETQLLHICWLVEQTLVNIEWAFYRTELVTKVMTIKSNCLRDIDSRHATWQQRAQALAIVKGVDI